MYSVVNHLFMRTPLHLHWPVFGGAEVNLLIIILIVLRGRRQQISVLRFRLWQPASILDLGCNMKSTNMIYNSIEKQIEKIKNNKMSKQ